MHGVDHGPDDARSAERLLARKSSTSPGEFRIESVFNALNLRRSSSSFEVQMLNDSKLSFCVYQKMQSETNSWMHKLIGQPAKIDDVCLSSRILNFKFQILEFRRVSLISGLPGNFSL